MARVSFDDADKYGGQGGTGFFQLKDDGDKARVRFMYDSIDDIVGDSVHSIEVKDENGKTVMNKNGRPMVKYVNCLREYNDPKDDCPFCREGKYVTVKLFIPVYNIDEDKVQIWERGKTYFKRMTRIASKCDSIVSQVFEIERDGKKGDQQTEYYIEPVGKPDDTTLDDLPPVEIYDRYVLHKSADDMEYYLQEGQFPPDDDEDDEEEERPVRRRGSKDRDTDRGGRNRSRSRRDDDEDDGEEERPARRRTPKRNEDVY